MNTQTIDAQTTEECPEPTPAPRSDVTLAGQLLAAYSDNQPISMRGGPEDGNVLMGALLYAIGLQLERIADALEADRG